MELLLANSITCPSCKTEIEVNEVLRSELTSQIRSEMGAELSAKRAELNNTKQELEKQRAEVDAARDAVEDQIRKGIEAQRSSVVLEAQQKARADLAVELQDRDRRAEELQARLKEAQVNELELRKRERDLLAQKEQLQLDLARQLEVERESIRATARQQYEAQHHLKDAEKEKQITDLRKQIDELKRKAEQGSQQLQGEVQELALEALLRTAFPADNVTPVAKGVCGGDSAQQVLDATGLSCGTILWESKRTKNWSHGWLAKVRDDQRVARAACAVIVSEALPDGLKTFALVDGVWVCSWACVRPLATALRVGLIEVAKSRLAVQGQHDKMEMVYNYLASQEFRNRVAGIVEAFMTMRQDLESEMRSMQRLWSKREKQLDRAMMNTAGMYGDLQGIIGASLPAISGLAINCIEYHDDEPVELHDGAGDLAN